MRPAEEFKVLRTQHSLKKWNPYPYPYIRLIIQLTHRNMITKIKQMIKKKNDKENRSTATESV